ncbi:leucine-rich repeat receptor-like protein kinase TDR [Salvia miltiorrhiza]|uniref:leucine-rich repeat receptor-like protein kinase TDR n=1 Tax=Salvia miltiorrhiza TaxID=226208 RepID=UPI0025ACF36D|nr:leucine-rich repeat receptor-like protein kinase TDR [Salvia miltiorrhiza]
MQVPMEILQPLYLILLAPLMLMQPLVADDDPLSYALLTLKYEILDHSNTLSDWSLPSQPHPSPQIHACSWTGVQCNHNSTKITAIDLSMKNLGGSLSGKQFNLFVDLLDLNLSHNSFSDQLPPGIFHLKSLTSLDISRNNFSGVFPPGISNLTNLAVLDAFSNSFSGALPADVAYLDSLTVLNFAGSYFSGPIPSDYGSFKSIQFIHLAGNFLNGNIPPELGNLNTLSHMEIGYNLYEGGIPWQFGSMSELTYLDIADAKISGPIPPQLSNLTKLESLFLFRNQLSGKIPWELSRISNLKSLDLSDNLLSGPIPDSFSELKNLKLLSLMYNELSGSVPDGIAKLPQLDTLLIWSNYFTGSLPEDLGRHSRLQHVDVSTNLFVGNIPAGICAGGELMKLILFSNNFTGGLSPSLSNCSSLVRLRVEDNRFSGDISLHFGNFPDVSYVDLSRNMFVGGVPSDIDQALRLEYFNVSGNPELGGVIPMNLWSLPNLQNFSMVSCGVSGNIPPFEGCKSVSVIELGMNNLSGNVEQSVSNCKQLVVMDLASNNLSGSIAMELATLPALTILDLSHNALTGPIPAKFGTSSSLRLLNVSYNDISGAIPSNKTFKMMDESAFLGNPKLCGAPLRACPRESGISNGLQLGSRRAQKLAWVLILCAVTALLIMAAVLGIVYLRRGSKGQWKMVAFDGLPQFTAKDVLRSFNCVEGTALPDSICKVVLPTGITVSARKIEWEAKEMKEMLQFLSRIGETRHENLARLLGICYNNELAYLLYDYMPNGNLAEKIGMSRDWESKCRIIHGVARALCFLHHDCSPPIPHGNLKARNVLLDENMEPRLSEFGLSSIVESPENPLPAKIRKETGGFITSIRDEMDMDVYSLGELILEVLTNGGVLQREDLLRHNDEGVKSAVEVALLCTRSRPADRPTVQDALKRLPGPKRRP